MTKLPCVDLVGDLVPTDWVDTVVRKAGKLHLARTLRDGGMEWDPRRRGAAARAAPRDKLVASPAALLLVALVARELRERDEHMLRRRLTRGRPTVDANLVPGLASRLVAAAAAVRTLGLRKTSWDMEKPHWVMLPLFMGIQCPYTLLSRLCIRAYACHSIF